MPNFNYTGRSKDGTKLKGEMEAHNTDEVAKQLKSINVYPLTIEEKIESGASGLANLQISIGDPSKLKTDDLVFFSRQLYTLIKSSVPIMGALQGLEETTDNPVLKKSITKLRECLDEGLDLTQALERQKDIYPSLFISLVHIGETTGKLAEVFKELSSYLTTEQETKAKVKSALRYPIIVLCVIAIGLVIISVFVIPNFADMYAGFNAELPLPTRILMGFSDFMINFWYICVGIPVLSAYAFLKYISTDEGRMVWHTKMVNLPLFGKLILQSSITRFARSLAITSTAGVPMVQALKIIAPSVGNVYIEGKINEVRAGVERGESVSLNIKRTGIFPGLVVQMISIGEEAGSIDEMINEVADYYEREIEYTIESLTAAIEPIMVVVIGSIVLIMALGIFLPMIGLMGAIK
ncbi:MAG: type II secretion system F family protein [Gammaproteobacteria bacterium]|nr:type II secretion system F family protein [Gammaproteobacteria bacterium]